MKAAVRGRKEIWTVRSALLAAVGTFPWLGAIVPAELARGRINVALAAFIAGVALLWLGLLVLGLWTLARRLQRSVRGSRRSRPLLLLPGCVFFVSLAAADAVALYHRGSVGFGLLASAAAGFFVASLVCACVAAFANP